MNDKASPAPATPPPQKIPHQLRECRFVKINHGLKNAFEFDWVDSANYAADDSSLLAHIAREQNFGVMVTGGLCVLDADNVSLLMEDPIYEEYLKNTFCVQTGRTKSVGSHYYFYCPDLSPEKYILYSVQKDRYNEMGDLRGSGSRFYVVGPGSIHPSGNLYKVINDSEPVEIPLDVVKAFIARCEKPKKKRGDQAFPPVHSSGGTITDCLGLEVQKFLMPLNWKFRDEQIEGAHPVHGSDSGTNLVIDPINNQWHCRRHKSGGGPLEALAVARKIILCEDAGSGCLEGHWPAIFDALRDLGYGPQIDEMNRQRSMGSLAATTPATSQILPSEGIRNLPKIKTNNRHMHEISSDAIRAIMEENIDPYLFRRGAHLVRVERDEKGRPTIREVNEHGLRGVLDRAACWYSVRLVKDLDGVRSWTECPENPPVTVVRDLLNLPGESWDLPPLIQITQTPIIHRDGFIHMIEGYDPETQVYYAPEKGFILDQVPEDPTLADVQQALDVLSDLLVDFPFTEEAGRWNSIGALLTGILRPIIAGPCPCWIVSKPQSGAGATFLQGTIYTAITGEELSAGTAPKKDQEWEKRIFAALLSGRQVQVLDNLEGSFRSDSFASCLTAREFRSRYLGRSEEGSVPARAVWFLNGNNVQIGGDLARRVYLTRIDPKMAIPWERTGFKHPDIIGWVQQNRGKIVASVLTLGRAWIKAGAPAPREVPIVGGFEGWRNTVGGVLESAGVTDFLGNARKVYLDADAELQEWERFLQSISEVFGAEPWTVADLRLRLDREDNEDIREGTRIVDALPDRLADAFQDPRKSFPKICGQALAKNNGRRFPSGFMLQKGQVLHSANQWVVIQTDSTEDNSLGGGV